MPRVIYNESNLRHNLHGWFTDRKRCFMYHYHTTAMGKLPEDWANLNSMPGCRYHGWVQISHSHRGELWSYATARHRTMITVRLQGDKVLWPEQYRKVQHTLRIQQKEWKKNIKRMIQTQADQYGFWSGFRLKK